MTKATGVQLEAVHPKPEEAAHMPYAPAVRIVGACDLMFISGATRSTCTRTTSASRRGAPWIRSSSSSTTPARAFATW